MHSSALHKCEPGNGSPSEAARRDTRGLRAIPWALESLGEVGQMKVLRKICATAAAAALSVALIAISAPAAEADSSWGGRGIPLSTP